MRTKMADPVSLEIPMQILKSSHANNSNCRAHLAPVGEQLGFPVADGFRSLHIRNTLTENIKCQRQAPLSRPRFTFLRSPTMFSWPHCWIEPVTTSGLRLCCRVGIWSMLGERTAVDFWCTPNVSSTQQPNLGHEMLHRILRVASGSVPQTRGC